MASDRQIAANRRNARKSTGPRSCGGKQRASRNAYRHGLSLNAGSIPAFVTEVELLARAIAGDSEDETKLRAARAMADSQLDIERVRRTKVALIRRVSVLGVIDGELYPLREDIRLLKAILRGGSNVSELKDLAALEEPAATMPAQKPERSAEAIRRALPELVKLSTGTNDVLRAAEITLSENLSTREKDNSWLHLIGGQFSYLVSKLAQLCRGEVE